MNINLIENDGFKVIEPKKRLRKSNNNANNYTKSMGRNESSSLATSSKQFYIYHGRIGAAESETTVKNFLDKQLSNVKIGDQEKKISYSNFKELNTNLKDRTYRSFTFSVGYLDKNIVNNKDIWPLYSIVNKYKLPKVEWLTLSEKYKPKPSTSNQ